MSLSVLQRFHSDAMYILLERMIKCCRLYEIRTPVTDAGCPVNPIQMLSLMNGGG